MNMDGNPIYGNWESGIGFIDQARLGTPSDDFLPNHLRNNKGKNHYYFFTSSAWYFRYVLSFQKKSTRCHC